MDQSYILDVTTNQSLWAGSVLVWGQLLLVFKGSTAQGWHFCPGLTFLIPLLSQNPTRGQYFMYQNSLSLSRIYIVTHRRTCRQAVESLYLLCCHPLSARPKTSKLVFFKSLSTVKIHKEQNLQNQTLYPPWITTQYTAKWLSRYVPHFHCQNLKVTCVCCWNPEVLCWGVSSLGFSSLDWLMMSSWTNIDIRLVSGSVIVYRKSWT